MKRSRIGGSNSNNNGGGGSDSGGSYGGSSFYESNAMSSFNPSPHHQPRQQQEYTRPVHSNYNNNNSSSRNNNNNSNNDNHYNTSGSHLFYLILQYLQHLIRDTFNILRPFLSICLALSIVVLVGSSVIQHFVMAPLGKTTGLVCWLPVVNRLWWCKLGSNQNGESPPTSLLFSKNHPSLAFEKIPDFTQLVQKQAAAYEILSDSLLVSSSPPPPPPPSIDRTENESSRRKQKKQGSPPPPGTPPLTSEDVISGLSRIPLPLLLKRAELAVSDLKVLVQFSSLPEETKVVLTTQLKAFYGRAKQAGRKLQILSSRTSGCVDSLVIRNGFVVKALDKIQDRQMIVVQLLEDEKKRFENRIKRLENGENDMENEDGSSVGIFGSTWRFVFGERKLTLDELTSQHHQRNLDILKAHSRLQQQQQQQQSTATGIVTLPNDDDHHLLDLFQSTMMTARDHVRDLILQSQQVLQQLEDMDQILVAVHEASTEARWKQKFEKDQVLSKLWTVLGGNRMQLDYYHENLALLRDVERQRQATRNEIQGALFKLTDFSTELELLREQVVGGVMDPTVGGNGGSGGVVGTGSEKNVVVDGQQKETNDDDDEEEEIKLTPPITIVAPVRDPLQEQEARSLALRSHVEQLEQITYRLRRRGLIQQTMWEDDTDE